MMSRLMARFNSRHGSTRGIGESRMLNAVLGLLAWLVGLIFFFPILWLVLSSLKEELDAVGDPKLFFSPTLERYREVTESFTGILPFGTAFANSLFVVLVSTALVLAMAIPAAYALAIKPIPKWRDVLLFFISTKFLPLVASILPIYIVARDLQSPRHADGPGDSLYGDEPSLGGVDAPILLPGNPARAGGGLGDRWRQAVGSVEDGDLADRGAGHRSDRAFVHDLRLERVLLCPSAQLGQRPNHPDLGDHQHQ